MKNHYSYYFGGWQLVAKIKHVYFQKKKRENNFLVVCIQYCLSVLIFILCGHTIMNWNVNITLYMKIFRVYTKIRTK